MLIRQDEKNTMATTPQEIPKLFQKYMNQGELEAVLSMYEHEAVIAPTGRQINQGKDAIRESIIGFLSQKPSCFLHEAECIVNGSVALIATHWTFSYIDENNKKQEWDMHPVLLARLQDNGEWLVAIDHPRI